MIDVRAIVLTLVIALAGVAAPAQEALPQFNDRAPAAVLQGKATQLTDGPIPHPFFDRQQWLALSVHSGIRLADTIKTCRELAHGGVEEWIPTQSCGGVAAWQAGSVGLALGVGWLLHKRGLHRLERIVPWIGSGASAAGFTKSVFNIK